MSLGVSCMGSSSCPKVVGHHKIESTAFALFICCALVTIIIGLFLVCLIFMFHRGGIVVIGRLEEGLLQGKEYHQNILHGTKME